MATKASGDGSASHRPASHLTGSTPRADPATVNQRGVSSSLTGNNDTRGRDSRDKGSPPPPPPAPPARDSKTAKKALVKSSGEGKASAGRDPTEDGPRKEGDGASFSSKASVSSTGGAAEARDKSCRDLKSASQAARDKSCRHLGSASQAAGERAPQGSTPLSGKESVRQEPETDRGEVVSTREESVQEPETDRGEAVRTRGESVQEPDAAVSDVTSAGLIKGAPEVCAEPELRGHGGERETTPREGRATTPQDREEQSRESGGGGQQQTPSRRRSRVRFSARLEVLGPVEDGRHTPVTTGTTAQVSP